MDLAAYRTEFPVTREWAYLNHAAVAPLPNRVVATVCAFLQARQMGDMALEDWPPATEETRALAARLVGADPEEIAFINSTSDGLAPHFYNIPAEIDRPLNVLEGAR